MEDKIKQMMNLNRARRQQQGERERHFQNGWSVSYRKPDYDALADPHASYYFMNRSMNKHLRSLKKGIQVEGSFAEKKTVKGYITQRIHEYKYVNKHLDSRRGNNGHQPSPMFKPLKSESSMSSFYNYNHPFRDTVAPIETYNRNIQNLAPSKAPNSEELATTERKTIDLHQLNQKEINRKEDRQKLPSLDQTKNNSSKIRETKQSKIVEKMGGQSLQHRDLILFIEREKNRVNQVKQDSSLQLNSKEKPQQPISKKEQKDKKQVEFQSKGITDRVSNSNEKSHQKMMNFIYEQKKKLQKLKNVEPTEAEI